MEYSSYGYHSQYAKDILTPRKTSGNIKGVELEISDRDLSVRERLDDMITEGILSAPDFFGENIESPVVISEDGSVYRELIVKACSNQRLFKTIKKLSENLAGVVENHSGTSCHIHYNDDFLETKGIKSYDMFKTAEFMAPILYRISERSIDSYQEWTQSILGDIENPNLFERGRRVDNLTGEGRNSRYSIINCREFYPTTELRIFSNHCSFDYDTIKFYIETADFLIKIAEYMQDKLYEEEVENIRKMAKEFFTKRNHKKFYEFYDLKDFFLSEKEFKKQALEKLKDEIEERFRILSQYVNIDEYEARIRLTRIFRDYNERNNLPEIEIRFEDDDIERNQAILINHIEERINNL